VLSATSLVSINVQGAGSANHGVLTSTGATTISGGFTAAYINGYVPAEGTFFDVLTATGGRTGEFTSAALPTSPPTDKTVLIYEGTRVRMLSTDLADLNLDGTTNSLDFVLFLNWYTSLDSRADTNGDGNINSLDFILYLNWFTDG
ncbi:MAG TPA: dockerin type I repeat-containing protein, partial [Phycisphaerales bacterium]|nr:dockerin type I repeat-containing protein [Phycisphaerales bacterium]